MPDDRTAPAGLVVVGDPLVPPDRAVVGRVEPGPPEVVAATVARLAPSVVVLQLTGARGAGPATVAALLGRVPDLAVVAVTEPSPESTLVLDVVRAGAAGVAATTDPAELAVVLAAAEAGRPAFSPGLAAVVLESVATPSRAVPELSPRETEVLGLVVEGLTARQIAARLVLSPRTVENHVQRLLRKLGVPGRGALVRYAIENGLA